MSDTLLVKQFVIIIMYGITKFIEFLLWEDYRHRITYKAMHTLSQKLNKLLSDRAELELSLARSLQKSILQEAIQGKLVPQIPEEGTAKELLEQIRQEKHNLAKEGKLKSPPCQIPLSSKVTITSIGRRIVKSKRYY